MKNQFLKQIVVIGVLLHVSALLFAQVVPCKLFSSGMVLQRNKPIPVWGTAPVGDTVCVSFEGNVDTVKVSDLGRWKAMLPVHAEGGPYIMYVISKGDTLTYSNVYVGDVFLCMGQSNMEMSVSGANNATANIAASNDLMLREFKVPKNLKDTTIEVLSGGTWNAATPATVGSFSAAAYYCAKNLRVQQPNIPIGILNVSYGGSRIETWMSKEMLGYDETFVVLAKGEGERQPTLAYNAMVNPIIGVPISAFLWYQGESNADSMEDAIVYSELFKNMITLYRTAWGMGDLPFIWVQLPNQSTVNVESSPQAWDTWPQIRAGQSRALTLPNTAEAITIEVGDVDIHPKDKESVGLRLSLAVRKLVYGENIVSDGPRYKSHTILPDGKVKIEFSNIGTGLVAKDTTNGGVRWFAIAGADNVLKKADAVIENNAIIVSHPQISNPKLIRYAWEFNPLGVNLYNSENLPASPFKIDVESKPFGIQAFTSTATKIERGSFITLQWKTSGNAITTLNGIVVDSISAAKFMPLDTAVYTLKIVDSQNATIIDSINIQVNVIDPLPTIVLSSKFGNVSAPLENVILQADAKAPGGGTVKQVEFYVDDVLVVTDDVAPYEYTWVPDKLGNYVVTGLVINTALDSAWASPYTMYINNLTKVRYEAELATRTGSTVVTTLATASNKKYVKVQEPFTITFKDINTDTAGVYQLNIRYQMSFDPTKEQEIIVNGKSLGNIRFMAPNTTQWMDYGMQVTLKAGANEIMIKNSWGWMSFDYIDILGTKPLSSPVVSVPEFSDMVVSATKNGEYSVLYSLQVSGNVQVKLIDTIGKEVTCFNGKQEVGKQTVVLPKVNQGTYIVSVSQNSKTMTQKVVIK